MKKVRQTSIKKASYLIQPNDCRLSDASQRHNISLAVLRTPFAQSNPCVVSYFAFSAPVSMRLIVC